VTCDRLFRQLFKQLLKFLISIKPDNTQLPCLLTYKFIQDHLELFFSAVRARGEWYPNSTCTQFSSTYRRLLIHYEIARSKSSVEMQGNTTIFTVSSSAQQIKRIDRYDPAVYNKIANLCVCKKMSIR